METRFNSDPKSEPDENSSTQTIGEFFVRLPVEFQLIFLSIDPKPDWSLSVADYLIVPRPNPPALTLPPQMPSDFKSLKPIRIIQDEVYIQRQGSQTRGNSFWGLPSKQDSVGKMETTHPTHKRVRSTEG